MNPFDKHGIKHLSPSALNKFIANPALYVGQYLLGWKDEAGPAAKRGQAVEAGLDCVFFAADVFTPSEVAVIEFAALTSGVIDAEHDKERAAVPLMLQQALKAAEPFGKPLARQGRVEVWLDGIEVPVVGYYDYLFEDFGLDLKTTWRIPSAIRPDHARQLAIYSKAKGVPFKALYCSDKKFAIYELTPEVADSAIRDLERSAKSLRHLLARAENGVDAARFYPLDFDHFFWTDRTKLAAEAIW